MPEYQLFYSEKARSDLKKLDTNVAGRIIKKIHFFSKQKNPLEFAKKLKNCDIGEFRFRVGFYRVIFDVDNKGNMVVLMILSIKHRKDVYDL